MSQMLPQSLDSARCGKEALCALEKPQRLALGFGLGGVVIRQAFDLLHDGRSPLIRQIVAH